LSINSTLLDIEERFAMKSYFENETLKRRQVAPVWTTALTLWIYEIEHYMLGLDYDDEKYANIDYNHHLIYDVYLNITSGVNKYLYEYANELVYEIKNGELEKRTMIEIYFKDIARGVAIAFILPKLKTELRSLEDQPSISKAEIEELDIHKEKDKLTTKQQILLLHILGIFDLPHIQSLTEQKRGILFGYLLNRNEKNTEDTIRNRFAPFPEKIHKPVLDLLKALGIDKN
jgi:hypothetical protein